MLGLPESSLGIAPPLPYARTPTASTKGSRPSAIILIPSARDNSLDKRSLPMKTLAHEVQHAIGKKDHEEIDRLSAQDVTQFLSLYSRAQKI